MVQARRGKPAEQSERVVVRAKRWPRWERRSQQRPSLSRRQLGARRMRRAAARQRVCVMLKQGRGAVARRWKPLWVRIDWEETMVAKR